jgi:hypothetical protein
MRLGTRIVCRSFSDRLLPGPEVDIAVVVDHDDPAIRVRFSRRGDRLAGIIRRFVLPDVVLGWGGRRCGAR